MADQLGKRPLHVLSQYVRGMAEASTGPDGPVLRRLHDHLRSATELVRADYVQIHESLRAQQPTLHGGLSGEQLGVLDRAVARIGVAAEAGLAAPLRPRELADHLRARARTETDPTRQDSMRRLAGFLSRPAAGGSTAPEVLAQLGQQQWTLEHGMAQEQKAVLDDVVRQTRELAGSPARVRGYGDWAQLATRQAVAEAAPRSERWLDRRNELDRLVSAAEGSVVVHTDTAGSVAVRYGTERSPGRSGVKTFGDGAHRGSRPELGRHFTHEPATHGGFHDPQGQPVHPIEAVTFEPVGDPAGAVRFGYAYNHRMAGRDLELPAYTGSSDGNLLVVHAVLPKSTAEALGRTIARDPQFARDLAERLVVERGGLPKDIWEHGKPPYIHRTKPPYEQLPEGHRIHRFDPGPDGAVLATPLEWATPRSAEPQPDVGVEKFTQAGGIEGPHAGTAAARPAGSHGASAQRTQDPHRLPGS